MRAAEVDNARTVNESEIPRRAPALNPRYDTFESKLRTLGPGQALEVKVKRADVPSVRSGIYQAMRARGLRITTWTAPGHLYVKLLDEQEGEA
jgi:hypothetical protein